MPAYATAAATPGQTESQGLLLQRIVPTLAQTLETLLHSKLHQRDTSQPETVQEVTAASQHPEPATARETRPRPEMCCGEVAPALCNQEHPQPPAPGVSRQCARGIKRAAGPLPGKQIVLHNRWSPREDQGQEGPQDASEGGNDAGEPEEAHYRLKKKETDLVEKVETLDMNIKALAESIEGLKTETAERQQVAWLKDLISGSGKGPTTSVNGAKPPREQQCGGEPALDKNGADLIEKPDVDTSNFLPGMSADCAASCGPLPGEGPASASAPLAQPSPGRGPRCGQLDGTNHQQAEVDGDDDRGHGTEHKGTYTNIGGWVTCAACARQAWLYKLPARHSLCRSCRHDGCVQGEGAVSTQRDPGLAAQGVAQSSTMSQKGSSKSSRGVHWQQIPPEAVARIAMAAGIQTAGQLAAADVRVPKIVIRQPDKDDKKQQGKLPCQARPCIPRKLEKEQLIETIKEMQRKDKFTTQKWRSYCRASGQTKALSTHSSQSLACFLAEHGCNVKVACRYYDKGHCKNGSACMFSHATQDQQKS